MKYIRNIRIHFSNNFANFAKRAILVFAFLLLAMFSTKTANAGLSSLFGILVAGEEVSAKSTTNNHSSQTMALPVVAVNIDPNPDKTYEIIPVVDGKTLASDIASANQTFNESSSKISVYVVREGDTISSVAKMFNVSINTILWANNLSSKSALKVGQNLTILPVSGIKYVVQKNDTISTIASKYKADVDEIYSFNDLDRNSRLVVGQTIVIPDAEMGQSNTSTVVVRALNGMIVPNDPLLVNVRKLPAFDGYYTCPVKGVLTQGLHGRNSVDLAAPIGTPIYASASGVVTISKSNNTWNGGYGNFVVLSHSNGTQTLYGHMKKTVVDQNEQVDKGEIIGYVGISGMTTGPHVHFEVRGAKNPFADNICN